MKVAIIQSNYIPWKGYFDIIHDVDLFVFYDDVQYTSRDWRNRNKIKCPQGEMWLTVPTGAGSTRQEIREVEIPTSHWAASHWKSLRYSYGKSPHFKRYQDFFEHAYLEREWTHLSPLNQFLTETIAREFLGIQTRFVSSEQFTAQGHKQDRLLDILHKAGASAYMSGPAAKAYMEPLAFEKSGIQLLYKDYVGYPLYPQLHPPFTHAVSVLDLLFQVGPDAPYYIWGWREGFEKSMVVPFAEPTLTSLPQPTS